MLAHIQMIEFCFFILILNFQSNRFLVTRDGYK